MKKKLLIAGIVLSLMVVGFVFAATSQPAEEETVIEENNVEETSKVCGSNGGSCDGSCGGKCGGLCGAKTCGCSKR
jgi:hypothetical protein